MYDDSHDTKKTLKCPKRTINQFEIEQVKDFKFL